MRVAVSQFSTTENTQKNLATCIRILDDTAKCKPDIIILPECCNSQPNYVNHNATWRDALTLDSDFLKIIAEQAKKYSCYIAINVTLRRDIVRDHPEQSIKSKISITSCLFSPEGELVHQENKQQLTKHEQKFFTCSDDLDELTNKVITTPITKIGLLSGDDISNYKRSRELAVEGAQLVCHSTSTFALDQSNIHAPARACENRTFFASANKVGTLFSQTEDEDTPQSKLDGSGQSQIISPQGKVLAQVAKNEEGYAYADININKSGISQNLRPDGTNINNQRRPELYQELLLNTSNIEQESQKIDSNVPTTANVAIFATYKSNESAIEDVCHYIENNLSDIIQLPELFFISDKTTTQDANQRALLENLSKQVIEQVSAVLRPFQYLSTSLIIDDIHQAVIISKQGLLASQPQLHFCQRYQWSPLGDDLNIIELPLEQGSINLAMLTADDAHIAEMVAVTSLSGIQVLLVPFDIQEPCEVDHKLLAYAAENKICIVAASREKDFANEEICEYTPIENKHNPFSKNKVKAQKSTGVIINLTTAPSTLPQWRKPKLKGYINQPLVKLQYGKITKAVIHPIAASYKQLP
ncbi:MAG: carbon-nitrogen hydrolase [Colwellia sp.]|nr:carbon-nitrogen hydrolase [Colwellia sp.]